MWIWRWHLGIGNAYRPALIIALTPMSRRRRRLSAPRPLLNQPSPLSEPHYAPKHLAALEAERNQVTVLFADLKGSMELLADRDLEEARKPSIPSWKARHRYEGTVNQVMGGWDRGTVWRAASPRGECGTCLLCGAPHAAVRILPSC